MCLSHSSEHLRGPFGLMPLMQVLIMRVLHDNMLPEWHGLSLLHCDMRMAHASAISARLDALTAFSCLCSIFLAFIKRATAHSRSCCLHLGTIVSDAPQQGAALSDHHAFTTGNSLMQRPTLIYDGSTLRQCLCHVLKILMSDMPHLQPCAATCCALKVRVGHRPRSGFC